MEFRLRPIPQQLDSLQLTGERFIPYLIGHVHDTYGRPVEGADVLLAGESRNIRTNAAGRFRIDSLEARRYQLTVRLPGYAAAHSLVSLKPAQPTEVALRMEAFAQDLGTIEVEADRRGLYGVVGTPDRLPIVGASVRIFGGGTSQLTDSAGRFAFPRLKPGEYLVGAEVEGMVGRTLQIEMPRNGRREVVLTLTPVNPSVKVGPQDRWVNHDQGLALSFASSFNRLGRTELARHTGKQLCDIGRIRMYAEGNEATIVLNGERALNPWSLCAFNADEVALVVIYPRTRRGGDTTCLVRGVIIRPPPGIKCISVWTR
jgi:protocatechuate 3,4-dioxygenase beta subunit